MSETKKDDEIQHVVEEATGFNLRSLKTMRDLLVRPNAVFSAYAARDRETYTPALRLWLGLVGLQVIVSALWGGWAGIVRRQIEALGPEGRQAYERLSGGDLDAFLAHYADAANVLQPILTALFTALSIFLLGAFNKTLGWSSRISIAMGVLTVGTLIGLSMMPVMMFSMAEGWSNFVAVGAVALAYFITFVRGAPGVLSSTRAGAWVKGALYTVVLMLLMTVAGLVLGIASGLYATVRVGAI